MKTWLLLLIPGVVFAQGSFTKDYTVTNSWEAGYRFAEVGGNEGTYRSDVNYGNGIRLFSGSLSIHSVAGHGKLFDELVLTTAGLGNDPYQSATFRVQKNRIYRYDMLWRSNDYFNPGLTVASGEHLENTTHRWQDHDLTIFPQGNFRIHAGYGHVTQDGPALTTEQEFDTRGDVFPIFRNIRQGFNEYRLGFDARFHAFRFTMQRRWEYFKDDSASTLISPEPGTGAAILKGFQSSQPYRGRTPGWMGDLIGEFHWIVLHARATYAGGTGNFAQNEIATGTDRFTNAQNQQITVTGDGNRPVTTGDFSITLFPSSRLSVVNNVSAANTRMDGDNFFSQFTGGTFSFASVNFQFLGIRLITNATDVRYRVSKKFDVFGGYRYSDRQIRSTEDLAAAGTPLSGTYAERSDHTSAGVLGANWMPFTGMRMHVEGELGRNDNPFTPISARDYHLIRARAQYRHQALSLGASYQENYNNDSIVVTSYSSHSRNYSANASWVMKSGASLDLAYSKLHLDTIGGIAFFAGSPFPQLNTGTSRYISNLHSLSATFRVPVQKRADFYVGYNLTKDNGDGRASLAVQPTPVAQIFYNVQTFPLTFESPFARLSVRLAEKLRWNAGYQYYAYHEKFGVLSQLQNYHAHTGYTSLQFSF